MGEGRMSCLSVSELPLSGQIAIELAWNHRLMVLVRDVLTTLDAPAESPAGFPLGQSYTAGASISLPSTGQCT